MIKQGEEYLGSLDNFIARKKKESGEVASNPEYEKRVGIAKEVIDTLDGGYELSRASIFDAMVNGEYKNGVLAFGPTLVNTRPDRRADVERLAEKAGKLYKAILIVIEDYGIGKTDVVPEFEVGGEDVPEPNPKKSNDNCDQPYFQ